MRNAPPGSSTMFLRAVALDKGSIARERHRRLLRQIDERLAADVDDRLVDRAADERPRRVARIVIGDRLAALFADVQALARERLLFEADEAVDVLQLAVLDVEGV